MPTFAQKQSQPQQKSSASVTRLARSGPAVNPKEHLLEHFQLTTGDQATQRSKTRANRREPGSENEADATIEVRSETPTTTHYSHDFSRIPVHTPAPLTIQPKLAVNTPGDVYEQEADHIAEQVMGMPEPKLQPACACNGGCSSCQTEQPSHERARVQTKYVGPGDTGKVAAPPIVHEALASPGQPLDTTTRAFFEPRFGHNFSRVRVHTDASAAQAAQGMNARAFTIGQHIYFSEGQYKPEYAAGQKLVSHELTHVIQQGGLGRSGSTTVHNYVPTPAIQRQFDIGGMIGETIGSVVGGSTGRVLGGVLGRRIEARVTNLKRRLERILDAIRGKEEVKLSPQEVSTVNFTLTLLRGLLPAPYNALVPNPLSGREERFSPLVIVLMVPAFGAFVSAVAVTLLILSAALVAIAIVEGLRYIDEITDNLEKAQEVTRPIPTTPTAPVPVRPEPRPEPTPKTRQTTDVTPAPQTPDADKERRRKRCRDKDDPCNTSLPILWPMVMPLPSGHDELVRTPSGDRYFEPDQRSHAQREFQNEIRRQLVRHRAGAPDARVPQPCFSGDNDPNALYDAHHAHPLFLGGAESRDNLCALLTDKHQQAHRELDNQNAMRDQDGTWITCRVCEGILTRHPGGQEYEIVGRKG